jgi:hypothetical protein
MSPQGTVFSGWDCYSFNASNGSLSTPAPLPNITETILIPANTSMACVAVYNASSISGPAQLALLALLPEAYNGSTPNLQAIDANTSNLACEENPSTRWAPPNVTITSPSDGWCGAGSFSNGSIPAGSYTLVAITPVVTTFARWECYNISAGNVTAMNATANNATNSSSATFGLELGASVTCVAVFTLEQPLSQLALLSQLPAAYNGTATPSLTAFPDGVGSACVKSPSVRIDANISITAPGSAGLCGTDGSMAAGNYSLGQALAPANNTFDRWQCYSVNSTNSTLLNLTAPSTVELQRGTVIPCVAVYTLQLGPLQLSLLSQVNAAPGFPYTGSGGRLTALGPSNSSCSKLPSDLVSSTVNATTPGPGGQCGAANLAAAGQYNLTQVAPNGTIFVRWECYNVTGGSAGTPLVADSVNVLSNEVWTCIARKYASHYCNT